MNIIKVIYTSLVTSADRQSLVSKQVLISFLSAFKIILYTGLAFSANFLLEEEKRNKNFLSVITGFGHTTARRNNERTAPNEYLQQGLIRVEGDER